MQRRGRASLWYLGLLWCVSCAAALGDAIEFPEQRLFFQGEFEDGSRFQANLAVASKKEGKNDVRVLGNYWLLESADSFSHELWGTVAPDGSFRLRVLEFRTPSTARSSSVEGIRRGQLIGSLAPGLSDGSGVWVGDGSGQPRPFKITLLIPSLARSTEIGAGVNLTSVTPSIPWLGSIEPFTRVMADCQATKDCTHVAEIAYYSESVISLVLELSSYDEGAAHGLFGYRSFTFKTTADRSAPGRRVFLREIVNPSQSCIARLSGEIEKILDRFDHGGAWGTKDLITPAGMAKDEYSFALRPRGLNFYFAPNVISSYGDGGFHIFVPFAKLGGCVRKTGATL